MEALPKPYDFNNWGIKTRNIPELNYTAIWHNLKTLRIGHIKGDSLPPLWSEFYDVSLGRMCQGRCPFCYTDAKHEGKVYRDVTKKIRYICSTFWNDPNHRPFQVALGSEGEPTLHPEFGSVCEALFDNGIVPNYTTNGITLNDPNTRDNILLATAKYVGGVAVSVYEWNDWKGAVGILKKYAPVCINLHIIVSDCDSVNRVKDIYNQYGDSIHTYVILPLMKHGRSKRSMTIDAFHKLQEFLSQVPQSNFALGANMYNYLIKRQDPNIPQIKCCLHEPEIYSKNLILDDVIRITPSSFNTDETLERIRWNVQND